MKKYTRIDYTKVELPEELLTSFAKALAPEIRSSMIVTRAKLTLKNGLPNTLNMMNGHLMQLHRASEFSHIRQQIKDAAIENL